MPDQVLGHCPKENREPLEGFNGVPHRLIAWRPFSKCVLNGEAIEDGVIAAYAKG